VGCLLTAFSVLAPSSVLAQDALDKFGLSVFGEKNLEKYAVDLSRAGEQLRPREAATQAASQTALTFLVLLASARSDQEWSIVASLRPNFNVAWRYVIETGSLAGQQLQDSSFGKQLPEIQSQGRKVFPDAAAAAAYVSSEAFTVGPYGRSAGETFRVWRSGNDIGDSDLKRLAEASKSGVIEKIDKVENKELQSDTGAMIDIVVGIGTITGDVLLAFGKGKEIKSLVVAILSVPGAVTQFIDGIKKLRWI
jgi:hypothetical protein